MPHEVCRPAGETRKPFEHAADHRIAGVPAETRLAGAAAQCSNPIHCYSSCGPSRSHQLLLLKADHKTRADARTASDLGDLPKHLQARLDAALASAPRKRVVAVCCAGGRRSAAGLASEPEPSRDPAHWTFPAGCLTKLLTGALLGKALRAGRMRLEDRAAEVLDEAGDTEALGNATIRDLLDHTHGLDDAAVRHAPIDHSGCIDVRRLLDALAPHRLAPPGDLYSYSNAGAWLIAAILERLHGKPFAVVLRTALLEPLGTRLRSAVPPVAPELPEGVCASMGAALAVSGADMLAFLEAEVLARPEDWPPARPEAEIRPLPGWNALERGIFRGWKHLGEHWFGHHSVWPQASAMVRVQPHLGIAIVLASTHHPAPVVAAKLFADVLPEFRNLSLPKPLSPEAVDRLELETYCGRYHSARDVLAVQRVADARALRLAAAGIDAPLAPANDEIFLAHPAHSGAFTFVQFLQRDGGRFRYLWDGRRVYRRSA